ncbi:MAG: IS630 family transposase [Chloroflexi bacterium]|nr:IS630 family transposase [Chloroflexota bacterium]
MSRQAVGRVALRAHMVLMSNNYYPVPFIAVIHDCGRDVVRTWLRRYEEQGVAGLQDEPRSGRPRKDPTAPHVVDAQASNSPQCSGLVQSCWTVGLLAVFLAASFGLALSWSTVRRCLKLMGWRWSRPRLGPARLLRKKRDPEEVPKLAAIAAALEVVAGGVGRLLYLDECDLHLLPVLRAMWMKGPRVVVPTPGKNAKHAFFGALEATSGIFHWVDRDRKLAVHFLEFLKVLAATYPEGPLYLVMDSAPSHTAKIIEAWFVANPRLQALWLPKYSAHEANPAERIWGLMKGAVAANRLAGSIGELVATARHFFEHELPPHPVRLPVAA